MSIAYPPQKQRHFSLPTERACPHGRRLRRLTRQYQHWLALRSAADLRLRELVAEAARLGARDGAL